WSFRFRTRTLLYPGSESSMQRAGREADGWRALFTPTDVMDMRYAARWIHLVFAILVLGTTWVSCAVAQGMPGVENSVGYLSSGTSIQPQTTSESVPMIHGSLGNWNVMLHANAFLV